MAEIRDFCTKNNISYARDSYYFTIDDKKYRVSNHTIEASNAGAYRTDEITGERVQVREKYHAGEEDIICITASKLRIKEIYNNLLDGYKLSKRGYIIRGVENA